MPDEPPINLRRFSGRGRKPRTGDVFALGLPSGDYLHGRVVAGPLPRERAPMPGAYLVYVYTKRSTSLEPNLGALKPQSLLIPPVFINQLGWTKGYFKPVGSSPINEADLLRQHCFRRSNGDYMDEAGRRVPGRTEPCGEWGLGNHRTLDDQISDALGSPRAPGER